MVRAAPGVVGGPGAGRGDLQQPLAAVAAGRARCRPHDDQVVAERRRAAALAAQGQPVGTRRPVTGNREGVARLPAAALDRALVRRRLPGRRETLLAQHRGQGRAVARDLQAVARRGRADEQRHRLARRVAQAVGVAPDLLARRVHARPLVGVAQHRLATLLGGQAEIGEAAGDHDGSVPQVLAQEGAGALGLRRREDPVRRALLDHDAAVHEQHPVGDLAGEAHLVGDDQHGHVLLGKLLHDQVDLVDQFRVERRGGLVEQHDLGLHGQRPGDRHALLLAAGEARGIGLGLVRQADLVEQLLAQRPGRLAVHALQLSGRQRHVFHAVEVGEQIEVLEHHAHVLAHGVDVALEGLARQRRVDLHAVEPDLAAVQASRWLIGAQQGALARADGPDDGDDLAALDR